MGAIGWEGSRITDTTFLVAARTLAEQVSAADLSQVALYPALRETRAVSLAVATAVAEQAYEEGVATLPRPKRLREHLAGVTYDPTY